jgi:hypothetical protein
VDLWARNGLEILSKVATSTLLLCSFTCRKARHGTDGFTSPPKEGVLRIFSPQKSDGFGLKPRAWMPKASTLPLDQRSRCCFVVTFLILSFPDILEDLLRTSISVASTRLLLFSVSLHISEPYNGLLLTNTLKEIEQNQLTWYGHVQRMAEGKLPKISFEVDAKTTDSTRKP